MTRITFMLLKNQYSCLLSNMKEVVERFSPRFSNLISSDSE